jgi:hypothetical protein
MTFLSDIDWLETVKGLSIWIYIAATAGVLLGVYWEREGFPKETQEYGWNVLVKALAVELLIGMFIFAIDGRISQIQKSQISAAVNRAAKAEEALVKYRQQRYLTRGQKDRIASVTKEFSSIPFVAFTALDQEPWTLVLDIADSLRKGGWIWLPAPDGLQAIDRSLPAEGKTIADRVIIEAPTKYGPQAKALVAALTDPAVIGMDDIQLNVANDVGVLTVIVGSKR